jgi:hypothetical protein
MGLPWVVTAQEAAPRAKAATSGKPGPKPAGKASAETKAQASANPKRVLRLEELKVEGRIQKPQAMFLMPRANLNYGDLERGESFVPKLAEPLQSQPF